MSVTPVPSPSPGTAPWPSTDSDSANLAAPASRFTPNPYAIPDSIVSSRAATATDPYQEAWNFAVGGDLSVAADPNQPAGSRLLHAGLAASILVRPGR